MASPRAQELKDLPLFAGLRDGDRELLARSLDEFDVPAGTRGDFFGEISVQARVPATATVVSRTPVRVTHTLALCKPGPMRATPRSCVWSAPASSSGAALGGTPHA